MFNMGMPELILILVIALIVFGPGKLPEIGKALGRSLQEFRQATAPGVDARIDEKKGTDNDKIRA